MKIVNVDMVEVNHYDIVPGSVDKEMRSYGGDATEGFDFFIDADLPVMEVNTFLEATLKKYGKSGTIYVSKHEPIPLSKLWDYKRIEKCIKDG